MRQVCQVPSVEEDKKEQGSLSSASLLSISVCCHGNEHLGSLEQCVESNRFYTTLDTEAKWGIVETCHVGM